LAGVALGHHPSHPGDDRQDPPHRREARLITLRATCERWPLREAFTIARGSKREAIVVVVHAARGDRVGRGEAVPYARYGEDPAGVVRAVEKMSGLRSRAEL